MTTTVRRVEDNEFFTWLDLYAGYGEFYETPLTDEKALLVWSWITDSGNELEAYFAVDDDGAPDRPRPRARVRAAARRQPRAVPRRPVRPAGCARRGRRRRPSSSRCATAPASEGLSVVRWITAKDNETARRVYDRVAEKTKWVTYDLVP